jgi:hypothetical protein
MTLPAWMGQAGSGGILVDILSWIWWPVPLIVAGVGVVVMFLGLGHLVRGRPGRSTVHLAAGIPAAFLGFAASLLGINAQTYARLTYEAPVALVSIKATDPGQSLYAVTVKRLDTTNISLVCNVQGDEWVLSGRVQKWKTWANIIGLNATYTLEQVSNMYYTAARANGKPITACDISGPKPPLNQFVPPELVDWLKSHAYASDRHFGSANYMPLADGAVYRVIITQSGFNAEPVNDAARKANDARP